jgi:hypothetical protein
MDTVAKQPEQGIVQDSACERTGCCSTTEDGSAMCMVPQQTEAAACGCDTGASACGCNSTATIQPNSFQVVEVKPAQRKRTLSDYLAECKSTWAKIRAGVMFVIACAFSPCCTPLFVPLILGLLAGTPAAVWLGQNLGWVYGVLTVISVVSFILAFRWMGKNDNRRLASSVKEAPMTGASNSKISSQSL